ncbi:hypothetical protein OQA88_11632 [Cercophora sp. LCS_1]
MAPRIILGLMGFAPDENTGARLHKLSDLTTALDRFTARGFHELDTARSYGGGAQEGVTRQAGWRERGCAIATKVYPLVAGTHSAEKVTEEFEKSLKELGADCIDIAYLHAPDRSIPFEETLGAMNELHKRGKFKKLGLSNYAAYEVAEMVMICKERGWVRPTVYQGVYNVLQRGVEAELLPACRRYGLDFVVYSPIVGGLLSGRYTGAEEVPTEGRFSDKFLGGWVRGLYWKESTFQAVRELKDVADKEGVGMVEVALRWLVHHSAIDVTKGDGIIIGVSRLEHLDANLDALEKGPLSKELLEAVERMGRIAKAEETPYWHGTLEYGYDTKQVLFGDK